MDRRVKFELCFFFLFFSLTSSSIVPLAKTTAAAPTAVASSSSSSAKPNPYSPEASITRYWNKQISNRLSIPSFLVSKLSPLSPLHSSFFTKLASHRALASHLPSFCSSANLFCFFDLSQPQPAGTVHRGSFHDEDSNFALYTNKQFSNYGTSRNSGVDSFKNYSDSVNFASSSFSRYTHAATGHSEGFASYADDGNVASSNFTSYAGDATGGSGDFTIYMPRVNVPDLQFASYSANGNNHEMQFKSYVTDTNSGNQGFVSYAKGGNGVPVDFSGYGDTSNVIGSTFTHYGEMGNAANDSFTAYSASANNPNNNFKAYGGGGNAGLDSFSGYRDGANAGKDTFQTYGRNSNTGKTDFVNYGKSFNQGVDMFKEYGRASRGQVTGFTIYGLNTTFKDYTKDGVTFNQYTKAATGKAASLSVSGGKVNKWVEEGKFFREYMLKEGTVMQMPDIRDKMPKRSFLPRVISSKLPFSSDQLPELKQVFHAADSSTMERVLLKALAECEREPSPGETKRCVGSVEDMVDFAVSVLGHNVVVRTTENVRGSNGKVLVGEVRGINGGEITKSVSCHQSLYPYLLYYCHAVPKVRVYEADILDVESKVKINDGVAICHIDTSAWSPGHGAFVALGSGPGQIEVCHWIFENDMTWTIAG